jgi:hypothetical protein
MTKITQTVRASIRTVLERSREFDATTMRIGADGVVTARKDADKTFAGNDPARYVVGHVDEMVAADGAIREGY